MNKATHQRFVQIHRAYASAIQQHLGELWHRPLSREEVNIVQSYALCGSFMSLESIERSLSAAASAERANEEFAFMQSEVAKHTETVIREVQRRVGLGPQAPQPGAFSNLLAWEEALLEAAK